MALPGDAGWIGLALVRRAALHLDELWMAAADDETGPAGEGRGVQLSQPEGFVAPPQGPGGNGTPGRS